METSFFYCIADGAINNRDLIVSFTILGIFKYGQMCTQRFGFIFL